MSVTAARVLHLKFAILLQLVLTLLLIRQEFIHQGLLLSLAWDAAGVEVCMIGYDPALLEVAREVFVHVAGLVVAGWVQGIPHSQQLQVLLE